MCWIKKYISTNGNFYQVPGTVGTGLRCQQPRLYAPGHQLFVSNTCTHFTCKAGITVSPEASPQTVEGRVILKLALPRDTACFHELWSCFKVRQRELLDKVSVLSLGITEHKKDMAEVCHLLDQILYCSTTVLISKHYNWNAAYCLWEGYILNESTREGWAEGLLRCTVNRVP